MGSIPGSFTLPSIQCTSQLINDAGFLSIREYRLDVNNLRGSSQINISEFAGATIYRIELLVLDAFTDSSGSQHNIEISCDSAGVLMNAKWNDPNVVGLYSTPCNATINDKNDGIHITHSLSSMVSGSAIVRFLFVQC